MCKTWALSFWRRQCWREAFKAFSSCGVSFGQLRGSSVSFRRFPFVFFRKKKGGPAFGKPQDGLTSVCPCFSETLLPDTMLLMAASVCGMCRLMVFRTSSYGSHRSQRALLRALCCSPMDGPTDAKKKAATWAAYIGSYVCRRCEVVRLRACACSFSRPIHVCQTVTDEPLCWECRHAVYADRARCAPLRVFVCVPFVVHVGFHAGPDPMTTQGTFPLVPDGDVINWVGAPAPALGHAMRPCAPLKGSWYAPCPYAFMDGTDRRDGTDGRDGTGVVNGVRPFLLMLIWCCCLGSQPS